MLIFDLSQNIDTVFHQTVPSQLFVPDCYRSNSFVYFLKTKKKF